MLYTGAPPSLNRKKGNKNRSIPGNVLLAFLVDSNLIDVLDPNLEAKKEEISEFLEDLKELGIGEQAETGMNRIEPVIETGNVGLEESSAVQKLSSQWAPLELCFGLPLFNDEANRVISQKVLLLLPTVYYYSCISIIIWWVSCYLLAAMAGFP